MSMHTWAPSGFFAPHPAPALRVLSLGLGVQSTCMLEMAADGFFGPMPDVAIFADTKAEPQAVYDHLASLQRRNSMPIPIRVISSGNLRQSVIFSRNTTGGRFASVPFFVRQENGTIGRGRRQCTKEFKLEPLWKEIRSILGIQPGKRVPRGLIVETWIGITTDEVVRASSSKHKWEHQRYPLIEAGMSRTDCIEELKRRQFAVPMKSACTFCPFRHNSEWRRIKEQDPDTWNDAVQIDHAIRAGGRLRGIRGEQFVHRSCVPLDQADLLAPDPRQLVMGDICGGACGT